MAQTCQLLVFVGKRKKKELWTRRGQGSHLAKREKRRHTIGQSTIIPTGITGSQAEQANGLHHRTGPITTARGGTTVKLPMNGTQSTTSVSGLTIRSRRASIATTEITTCDLVKNGNFFIIFTDFSCSGQNTKLLRL